MIKLSRRLARAALAASTALMLPASAMAAPQDGQHLCHHPISRLDVTGHGEARVAPDMATVQLGVTTQAPSASEAMRQNSTRQAGVIDALAAAGVHPEDVQTSGLNLNPVMNYPEGGAPTVTGYQASNIVSVRVQDVAAVGKVLDAIVSAGANEINGIAFSRKDAEVTEDAAQRAAVENARHKAEVLAKAAGMTLGHVIMLRDAPAQDGPRPLMMEARAAGDTAKLPISAGQVAMTAQVEMQFALTPADCETMDMPHHGNMQQGRSPSEGASPVERRDHEGMPHGHGTMSGSDKPETPAGDMPPPMGTDTGAPAPGEPVVPMGETVPQSQPPAN